MEDPHGKSHDHPGGFADARGDDFGQKKTGPWWENSREPGPGMEKTAMDLKSGGMILDRQRGVCIEVLKPLIPAELIR